MFLTLPRYNISKYIYKPMFLMRINYSIHPNSKYFLFADVPLRQGIHHIGLAFRGDHYRLSLAEIITHIAMGVLKLIPVIGHAIALVDTLCQRTSITHITLTSRDPFKRGEEHGRILKKRIKEVYDPILSERRNDLNLLIEVNQLEKQIPDELKVEMRGLASGSGYSYADVVMIHAFLDAQPGRFGCTSMVVKETTKECKRIAAANHELFEAKFVPASESRRQAFLNAPISEKGPSQEVLKSAGKDVTIQAMVFDTSKGKMYLSSQATHAAAGKFRKFGPDVLFGSGTFSNTPSDTRVRLFRNLDWPWYFLGQETVVLTRPQSDGSSTVSISWPGYIGTLSGMNEFGLALTANQCGIDKNLEGIPNPLLFTNILDTCQNVGDATKVIEQGSHGSSMNLVIADKTSAKSYELRAGRNFKCAGEIN